MTKVKKTGLHWKSQKKLFSQNFMIVVKISAKQFFYFLSPSIKQKHEEGWGSQKYLRRYSI